MILESDTVLDVRSTISTVEDIQNYKMDCHEINDDKNKLLCSSNKNKENSTGAKDIQNYDVEILDNERNIVKNNEADVNTSDLGALHSDKRNSDLNIHDTNIGECLIDKEIVNKSEEISEEDDLEDDIISFRDDSFNGASESQSIIEKDITKNDEALLEDNLISSSISIAKDIIDLPEDKDICILPCEKQPETSIENETHFIALKSIKDDSDNYEKEIQNQTEENSEESEECIILNNNFCIKEIDLQNQTQKESMMFKDKTEDSSNQCEKETGKQNMKEDEEVQIIELKEKTDQNNDLCATKLQAQEEMEIEDLTTENELVNSPCKNEIEIDVKGERKVVRLADESEMHEEMEIVETKDELEVVKHVGELNSAIVSCERNTETEIMDVDDCEQVVNNTNACKHEKVSEYIRDTNNLDVEIKEKEPESGKESELRKSAQVEISDVILLNECSILRDSNSERSELIKKESLVDNSPQEKDNEASVSSTNSAVGKTPDENKLEPDTQIKSIFTVVQNEDKSTIDNSNRLTDKEPRASADIVADQCENETDSLRKVDRENELSNSSETTIPDTIDLNSPAVKEIDITDSQEDVIETKDNLEPINLDAEDVVEQTSKNNDAMTTLKELTSNDSNTVKNVDPVPPVCSKENLIACKSSYTLDIFSDEDELPEEESNKVTAPQKEQEKAKECVNLDDDDDIMLIDENNSKPADKTDNATDDKTETLKTLPTENINTEMKENPATEDSSRFNKNDQQGIVPPLVDIIDKAKEIDINEKTNENTVEKPKELGPLLPEKFLNTAKTKLADMTRDDLEEFCILKIVEGIMDRTSLSEIKNKLKEMSQSLEDYRKKASFLSKQNRDLQVVLKSVQEEQKKINRDTPITPLKITRSVGVQVFMEKAIPRKKVPQQNGNNKNINTQQNKNPNNSQGRVVAPTKNSNQIIPVPRLVPANNQALKTPSTIPQMSTPNKNNTPNGVRNPSPSLKAEKRPHNKMASSETVDLTDDEPPPKLLPGVKTSPAPPVRLVPSQNLMAPQRQPFPQGMNSPRKVYIPISGPPNQALRPGQTIMLKSVPPPGVRARGPAPQRMESMRLNRILTRHPAPLPFATKQYQPPNWKSLPPAPDLKLSKVENGIVISWKIEDVPEDSYEEIASYQLFAYQETSLPASTALWKKIGDVKALPLPMACTLTQFMAGFKYYFAVRAVDIRSRLGPFSLPGSILLLNKNILD